MRPCSARIGFSATLVLCRVLYVAAAEPELYTLDRCIRMGLERSAAALNAQRDLEVGRSLIKQARAEALPQLSGSATYTRLDEVQDIGFGDESFSFGVLDNYNVEGRVEQLLYSGGRVRAAMRAAGLARDYYDRGYAHTRATVTRDVRVGFHDILLARAALEVRQETVAQLEAHARDAAQKERAGTGSEYDRLSARVRVANARPALIAAQKAYQAALLSMRRLLGVENQTFGVEGALVHRPVDTPLSALIADAVARREDLQQVELQVQLNRQQRDEASSGQRPSLRAYFSYSGANAYQFVEYGDSWEWHWNAGLVVDWTFWDGGLTAGRVRERQLELEKSKTTLDDRVRLVRMQVETAYLELERARQAIESGEGSVALARKALAIAETRFGAGLATSLEYSDSQLALRTAQLTRLQALHDHMNAVAELEYVSGLPYGALSAGRGDREEQADE